MPKRTRLLIVTADVLGPQMAGPAIRALAMARAASAVAEVRLVSMVRYEPFAHDGVDASFADEKALRAHADWSDVVVIQGHVLTSFPWLADGERRIVADIYDPMHLEVLEQGKDNSDSDRLWLSLFTTEVLNDQMRKSDFMLCASEKQRDFWLGQLAALSRINPATYDQDDTLRSLLDVVPFGIEDQPPVQRSHGIKGAVPGIAPDDKVILWGGGIYNWFDPITLITAVHRLSARHPDLRLFFLGVKHPNPNVPEMSVANRARELAIELGMLDRTVFFNEGWVPYDQRADFLLDADLGVSTHFEHLETAFSFRTRILDYIWASLPIVASDGDSFASIIRDNELGRVVPTEDIDALADALAEVLYDDDVSARMRANVAAYAQRMTWSQVLKPFVDYCAQPWRAPDLLDRVGTAQDVAIRELEKQVAGLKASTSWRVTRPLRWLAELRQPKEQRQELRESR